MTNDKVKKSLRWGAIGTATATAIIVLFINTIPSVIGSYIDTRIEIKQEQSEKDTTEQINRLRDAIDDEITKSAERTTDVEVIKSQIISLEDQIRALQRDVRELQKKVDELTRLLIKYIETK